MHLRAVALVAILVAVPSAAACTLAPSGDSGGQPTVVTFSTDASDDGAVEGGASSASPDEDAGAPEDVAVAPTIQGSPLCSASRSSACYPDDPKSCRSATDAGYGSGGSNTAFACRVSPSAGAGVGPACFPAASGVDGDLCRQSSDCAPGYECAGSGVCRLYCCEGDTKCASNAFCDIQPIEASPSVLVPVCMPVHPCALLDPSSCTNETCSVVREDGTTSCVPIGAGQAGQPCERQHCDTGLACLGAVGQRTCYTLCATSLASMVTNPCPAGQSCRGGLPLFPDPSFGICQ